MQRQVNKMMRLCDIIVDQIYQPRNKINSHKVNEYAGKMEQGIIFPPMVVDKETNKLISGFTRDEAYKKRHMDDPYFKVPVIVRSFENEAEKFFFTYDDNQHGEPLDSFDIKTLVFKLKGMGVRDDLILNRLKLKSGFITCMPSVNVFSASLGAPREFKKIEKKKTRNERVIVEGRNEEKPLKAGLAHLNGMMVSEEVYDNISNHYTGWNVTFIADQLIMRMKDGTINKDSENEMGKLDELYERLRKFLKK